MTPLVDRDPELVRLENEADDAAVAYEWLLAELGRAASRKLMAERRLQRAERARGQS